MIHTEMFSPDNPEDIIQLSLDSNEKVILKCGEDNESGLQYSFVEYKRLARTCSYNVMCRE